MEKFAFLFPGQGAQFITMGKYFYDSYLVSKQTYEEAEEVLGIDVANLCFHGSVMDINEFTNMQIAIVTTEIAIFRAYKQDIGIEPQFCVGHSIGEYGALVAAGAVEFKDILKILKKRGELVNSILEKNIGYMTVVEYEDKETILKLIEKLGVEREVYISCFNTDKQFVLSGTIKGMNDIEKALAERGAVISPLLSSPPMHSPLMESIREEYLKFLKNIYYFPFRIPIISNTTGRVFSDPDKIPELMADQLIKPVLFSDSLNQLYNYGVNVCIEMSPKRLICDFVKNRSSEVLSCCYGIKNQRQELKKLISEDEHYVFDKPDFIGNCLAILASTENRSMDEHGIKVIQSLYKKLKLIYQNKRSIDVNCYEEILGELINALRVKELEEEEIKVWIKRLLDNTNLLYKYQNIYKQVGIRE